MKLQTPRSKSLQLERALRRPFVRQRSKLKSLPSANQETIWEIASMLGSGVLKLSAFFGTLFALLYYIRIQYMPLDGLSGMAGLAGAISLVILGVFIGFVGFWGMPIFVFSLGYDDNPQNLGLWFHGKNSSIVKSSVSWWHVFGWCFATIGVPWFILFDKLGAFSPTKSGDPKWLMFLSDVLAVIALGIVVWFVWKTKKLIQSPDKVSASKLTNGPWQLLKQFWLKRMGVLKQLFTSAVFPVVYSVVGFFPAFVFFPLASLSSYASDNNVLVTLGLVMLGIVAVVGINIFSIGIIIVGRSRPLFGVIALFIGVIVSLLVLTSILNVWAPIQDRIMSSVSVRVPNAEIVLNKAGCQSLKLFGIKQSVRNDNKQLAQASAADVENFCVLKNVTILSRVGGEWPIGCDNEKGGRPWKLLLKNEDVISVLTNKLKSTASNLAVYDLCGVQEVVPIATGASQRTTAISVGKQYSAPVEKKVTVR